MVATNLENKSKPFGEIEGIEDCQRTDVTLLDESDIRSRYVIKRKIDF